MKRYLFSFLTLLSVLRLSAQEEAVFSGNPQRPLNGDSVMLSYNSARSPLKGRTDVRAVVYSYRNYKWHGADLELRPEAGNWKATVQLPADCGIIAVKYYADTLVDNNNNEGYFVMLSDKDRKGQNAKGAFAGWGLARAAKYNRNIPGYINKNVSDSAVYHWLNQEISFNQESRSELAFLYASALRNTFADYKPRLKRVLAYLERPDASQANLLDARKIRQLLLEDPSGADSITAVFNQRFPKGALARLKAYREIPSRTDMKLTMSNTLRFLADFPQDPATKEFDEENRISYGTLYQNLIILSAYLNKNYDDLYKYLAKTDYTVAINLYYRMVQVPFDRKDVSAEVVLPVARTIMERVYHFKANKPEEYAYLSDREWKLQFDKNIIPNFYATHMAVMNQNGQYRIAADLGAEGEMMMDFQRADMNHEYAMALKNLKETGLLRTVLEQSVNKNQSSVEMLALLKEMYIGRHGSEEGYQRYLSSLKDPSDDTRRMEELRTKMINRPMPAFAMKDLAGKTVDLRNLKGKTVILDFWATWCVPCKASFPGMKLAVEKYRNDPSVVFYFVDTEERGDKYKAEVARYIKENNYPFNILFDNKTADARTNDEVFSRVCKAFTISGIPQKIFIDKKGNVRFISVGFGGSATKLADEISSMVELTKSAE